MDLTSYQVFLIGYLIFLAMHWNSMVASQYIIFLVLHRNSIVASHLIPLTPYAPLPRRWLDLPRALFCCAYRIPHFLSLPSLLLPLFNLTHRLSLLFGWKRHRCLSFHPTMGSLSPLEFILTWKKSKAKTSKMIWSFSGVERKDRELWDYMLTIALISL